MICIVETRRATSLHTKQKNSATREQRSFYILPNSETQCQTSTSWSHADIQLNTPSIRCLAEVGIIDGNAILHLTICQNRKTEACRRKSNATSKDVRVESAINKIYHFPSKGKTADKTCYVCKSIGNSRFLHFLKRQFVVSKDRFYLTHRFDFHTMIIKLVIFHGDGIIEVLCKR